ALAFGFARIVNGDESFLHHLAVRGDPRHDDGSNDIFSMASRPRRRLYGNHTSCPRIFRYHCDVVRSRWQPEEAVLAKIIGLDNLKDVETTLTFFVERLHDLY